MPGTASGLPAYSSDDTLFLSVVAGPESRDFSFTTSDSPVEIGRLSTLACRLDDPTVSRRHAVLSYDNGAWSIEDLGSRGGTAVNGELVQGLTRLWDGDEIGIGPWRLVITMGMPSDSTLVLTDEPPAASSLQTRDRRIAQPLAARRLSLLLEYAERLHHATSEIDLAEEMLDAACRGAHYERGAVVRGGSGGRVAETLAREGEPGGISRSVLREAEKGQVVRLQDTPELMQAQSIMIDSVRDVLCVPVTPDMGNAVYLYLIREQAREDNSDDVDFCVALVRLAEIAYASLRRRGLEREIRAAREAQERIMPDETGAAPGLRYAMHSRPGRGVAGDLFDIIRVDEQRTVVLLGDITGKGAGPGVLMTAAQAFLNGEFRRSEDLLSSVRALNAYLDGRSMSGEFLTLWIGLYDTGTCELEYVDAGHGFVALAPMNGAPALMQEGGGPPLGISHTHQWKSAKVRLAPGDQVVLFSDGLVEQRNPAGELHGVEEVLEMLRTACDPETRVRGLIERVLAYAAGSEITDDLTLACVETVR